MKRKCNFCEDTTENSLDDFAEVGWNAFKIERDKTICGCPKHHEELIKLMKESLRSVHNNSQQEATCIAQIVSDERELGGDEEQFHSAVNIDTELEARGESFDSDKEDKLSSGSESNGKVHQGGKDGD